MLLKDFLIIKSLSDSFEMWFKVFSIIALIAMSVICYFSAVAVIGGFIGRGRDEDN